MTAFYSACAVVALVALGVWALGRSSARRERAAKEQADGYADECGGPERFREVDS